MPRQCVNELNQWLSALWKVSINNSGLLGSYHPGVFRGDKWSCCHQKDKTGGSDTRALLHCACSWASGRWLGSPCVTGGAHLTHTSPPGALDRRVL